MRGLALVLGLITLTTATGRHHGQQEPAFPQRPPEAADAVRLTLRDGRQVFLEQARVKGDSVVGRHDGQAVRVAIPLTAVQSVEGRRDDVVATIALALGITLVGGFGLSTLLFLAMGGWDQEAAASAVEARLHRRHVPADRMPGAPPPVSR